MLAKSNNGVFPKDAVYEAIDGSKTIPAHGTREMPIWGERFNLLSTCLTMLICLIGRWPGRIKVPKSSYENASSLLSII